MISSSHSNSTPIHIQEKKFIKVQKKGTKLQRFEFTSYSLAFAVREIFYHKIVDFDVNKDEQFQEQQIRDFLIHVLNENESEIHYFVKNVFRYDTNNDGNIEYDQLVNFCMEQHFGEIAIQRLHRKKIYQRGAQRVMSKKQFLQTIIYALSFIQFVPTEKDVFAAFESVDADCDGYISYQDYFRFLKEYFGSKSYAAGVVHKSTIMEQLHNSRELNDLKNVDIVKKYSKYEQKGNNTNNIPKTVPPLLPPPPPKIIVPPINHARPPRLDIVLNERQRTVASRIARLVYTQLKSTLIEYDSNKDCLLSTDDIWRFMTSNFGFTDGLQGQVFKRCEITRGRSYQYNEATKILMIEQLNRIFRQPIYEDYRRPLTISEFNALSEKVCALVKNTPLLQKYETLYLERIQTSSSFTVHLADSLLFHIFSTYQLK